MLAACCPRTCCEAVQFTGAILDCAQLRAQLGVTLIQHLADWAEPGLVQEHHQQQQLTSHCGSQSHREESIVSIENLLCG